MAKEVKDRVKDTLGGKKKSSKKPVKKGGKKSKKVHISKTANGKYLAEHEIEGQPNETHSLENMDELKDHLQETMGEEEEPAVPAQPQQQMVA